MMSFKSLFSVLFLLVCFATSTLAKKDDDEATEQAIRDMQIGMQGLKEAGTNPQVLAQMMKDMQDPELMAEAQKMMNSPSFQKQMKKMAGTKEFKENAKQTELILKDPSQAAEAEARMEHMVRVGNDQMKKAAGGMMEDAMAAMNDPGVMAEMTKMMKDPNFQQQLNDMMKDPSFSSYADAMKDMMKDPAKKAQFEAASDSLRRELLYMNEPVVLVPK